MPISDSTGLVSLLFALKKARVAVQNIGICCLIKVGKRESVLNRHNSQRMRPAIAASWQIQWTPLHYLDTEFQYASSSLNMQLKTDEGDYIKLSALPAHASLHTYFYYQLLQIQTWRTPWATWSHEGIICTDTLVRKSIITLYLELMLVILHLSQPQRSIVPLHNGEYNIHFVSCQCNTKTWILLLVWCYVLMKQQLSSSTVPCATVPCATVQSATYKAATVKFNSAMCHSAMCHSAKCNL